jgi:hypothetical protein
MNRSSSPAARGRVLSVVPRAFGARGFCFTALWLVLLASAGCSSSTLPTAKPVNVCRCRADEMCVLERCVPLGQTLLMDAASGGDADVGGGVAACDVSGVVLISELRHGATNADNPDFVELFSSAGSDLAGWRLQATNPEGQRLVDVVLSGSLEAQGYWLAVWGSMDGVNSGVSLGGSGLPSPAGTVALLDCEGAVRDEVAYGLWSSEAQVLAAESTREGESLGRCPGLGSSGDARKDFVVTATPTPGQPNTSIEQAPACVPCEDWAGIGAEIWLSEVGIADASTEDAGFVEVRLLPAGTPTSAAALEQWSQALGAWRTLGDALPGTADAEGRLLISGQAAEGEEVGPVLSAEGAAVRLVGCRRQPLDAVGYGAPGVESDLSAEQLVDTSAGSAFSRCPDTRPSPSLQAWSAQTASPAAANTCP